MHIKEISKEINAVAKEKGFWDNPRNVGEMLMLVTSELAEALEADRKDNYAQLARVHPGGGDWMDYLNRLRNGEVHYEYAARFEYAVKNTFEDEIADAVIRLFGIAEGMGIDLEWHIRAKVDYNKTRERMHGKKY